ncbi:MAG: 1-phosphatidylinositol-4-phosphate 5-kinase family protein [Actinobacteria bacterium]|nr:1-phosphatidylinositol-4-phosphate 5-kinase family protein [Actinomycetota bacterium]
MDVEFGIRYSQGPVKGIDENSEFPSWKRIDSVNMQARNVSSDSQSSNNSSIKKVIQTAMSNARNVFSPAFREFRFKDFCPKLFAKVREMHNISATEYSNSFETTCRERFSEGRSGAFMFYSSDQRCIVKTTKKEESQTLHRIMSKYVSHLESNPNSLIVRFLGSHCITMYGVEIYFVVMLNVFPIASLSERYDLKGSWVNRYGFKANRLNKRHRFQRDESESSPLYQDNDLQHSIKLEPDTANSLAGQIRRDILFLQSNCH